MHTCMCVYVCVSCTLLLLYLNPVYVMSAFVKLWITFSISKYVMCEFCLFITSSHRIVAVQISVVIIVKA